MFRKIFFTKYLEDIHRDQFNKIMSQLSNVRPKTVIYYTAMKLFSELILDQNMCRFYTVMQLTSKAIYYCLNSHLWNRKIYLRKLFLFILPVNFRHIQQQNLAFDRGVSAVAVLTSIVQKNKSEYFWRMIWNTTRKWRLSSSSLQSTESTPWQYI